MTNVIPLVPVSEKNRMKKVVSGPREETLALIRQFARIYAYYPGQRQRVGKYLLN